MNLNFLLQLANVLLVAKLARSESTSECREVDENKFPNCVTHGFTMTSEHLASKFYTETYSKIINNMTAKLNGCSKYTSYILCSLYVPRCKENMLGPLLPCREVCQEFACGCSNQMNSNGLNWLKPLCSLLPTKRKSATCFIPPDFKPLKKPLSSLQCSETVSNENCQKEECKMTFISRKTQKQLQDKLTTLMNKLTSTVFSDSCKQTLNRLACASYTPPCDGTKMKTLCKYRCSLLFDDCPEAFNFTEVSSYCAEPAQGDTTSGFCELTRWPSARHWDKGKRPRTVRPTSFPAGLIAALVLVPLSVFCFIYLAVGLRRRYEQKRSGNVQELLTYTELQTETADSDKKLALIMIRPGTK